MVRSSRTLQLSPSMERVMRRMVQGWKLTKFGRLGRFHLVEPARGRTRIWPNARTIYALRRRYLIERSSPENFPKALWRLTKKGREAARSIINHSPEAASDES